MTPEPTSAESAAVTQSEKEPIPDIGLLLRSVVAAAETSLLITDPRLPDNPIVFHNPAFERISGYEADEIDGRNCRFLQGPDTDPATVAEIRTAIRGGLPCHVTLLNYRRDGTPFWNDLALSPVHDAEGRLTHFVGIQNDVTARRQAEAAQRASMRALQDYAEIVTALRASEERFRALTENSSDVTSILTPDGTILYRSASSEPVLGYTPDELVGTSCLALIHPEDRPEVQALLAEVLASDGEHAQRLMYRYKHKDGSWRWIESIVRNQLRNPAIGGIVTNNRDVTERRRLEQQVLHTEKLASLGRLVAGVAHEINNPLAAISGHAQLLKMHPDPQIRDDASVIDGMAQRASRIVRSLRSFARTNAESDRISADLNDVVLSALAVVAHRLRLSDVSLEMDLSTALPPVRLNTGGIEQVIVNLLSNAEHTLQSCPAAERRLRIATSVRDGAGSRDPEPWCVLVIEDSGSGIPESILPRIFDPFFTTSDTNEGTGLGLYISHGIITAHNGTITVESQEGQGSRFTISLPVAAEPETATATESAPP